MNPNYVYQTIYQSCQKLDNPIQNISLNQKKPTKNAEHIDKNLKLLSKHAQFEKGQKTNQSFCPIQPFDNNGTLNSQKNDLNNKNKKNPNPRN